MENSSTCSRAAVAVAFSPRLHAVLAEAWRFTQRLNMDLTVIHAGTRTDEKEESLNKAFQHLGIVNDISRVWREGDAVDSITAACKERVIDLLIAGALTREVGETSGRHYVGTVARGLLKRAPASLLLFTNPTVEAHAIKRIVMITDFSEQAAASFRALLTLAESEGSEVVHIACVSSPLTRAGGIARTREEEQDRLTRFAASAADSPVNVETRVIESTTGMGAVDFTLAVQADLLVVPARESTSGDAQLPQYMDWIAQVIPCNLWVMKTHEAALSE
jgi:Universal stress protein family